MRGAGTGLAPTVIANARKDALEGKSRLGDIAAEDLRRFVARGRNAQRVIDALSKKARLVGQKGYSVL